MFETANCLTQFLKLALKSLAQAGNELNNPPASAYCVAKIIGLWHQAKLKILSFEKKKKTQLNNLHSQYT